MLSADILITIIAQKEERSMKYSIGIRSFVCAVFVVFSVMGVWVKAEQTADLVVYSYDRPLQLYAFLESAVRHISTIGEIHVIYRARSSEYQQGYETVQPEIPGVIYAPQSNQPLRDFKPLTLRAVFESPSNYIVFAVDDIIVTDQIRFADDIILLEQHNAYGFYYRLGTNL